MKPKYFLVLLLVLVFAVRASAQQFQAFPIAPQYQFPESPQRFIQGQQIPIQQPQIQPAQPEPFQQLITIPKPSVEKSSEFEEFVSEKVIEITESQLDILKKFEGITFSYTKKDLPPGTTAIAVKVFKIDRQTEKGREEEAKKESKKEGEEAEIAKPVLVDAGYLIGTPDVLAAGLKILGIKSSLAVSTDLKQFGYGFFREPSTAFFPQVPVGPDYVIGPGDEIRIAVWGNIEGQWNVVVDRDGNIALSKLGVLGVTGLKFEELRELLYSEFSKYYTGFEMNVSMGALRTIRVYVVGNAEKPGAYIVSSLSTLINALFEAGSPSKAGTLRDIQVKRNGDTIVHFDMYDFLLQGDKTNDIRLMPEDVIFIPSVGPLVGIAGSVNNPAIYELKGETVVPRLIEMASGLSDIAFQGRVQIDRIVDNHRQIVFESDLAEARDIKVQGGDIVKIFPIVQDKRLVRIDGAVHREGEYGFQPGMTVKDLISIAGGLKYYAFNKEAELTRIHLSDKGPRVEKMVINIEKALTDDPENNVLLKDNDHISVHSIPEWELYEAVTIFGEVRFPGSYNIEKGETLSSLIERAGGFTERAYLRGAVFTRERVKHLQQEQLDEMILRLERELLGMGAPAIATSLSGEEMQIRAMEIKQKREFIETLKKIRAKGRMVLKVDDPEQLKNTPYDVELEEGDCLFIPADPRTVQVIGSVYNQTAFVYDREIGIKEYIDLAGGYTENADKKKLYILKVDGSAVKPQKGIFWSSDSNRWEIGNRELDPGDTVVVPEKLERVAWLREVKDLTQIFYQIAVTAGVLIVAF